MRGLLVQNGDIVIGQNGYVEVTGINKIAQDVTECLLEPYGCDRFHPLWGSQLTSMIGTAQTSGTTTNVSTEVGRVIKNYAQVQQSLVTQTSTAGQSSNFTNDDILSAINSINVSASTTTINVSVSLTAASGSSVTLNTTTGS